MKKLLIVFGFLLVLGSCKQVSQQNVEVASTGQISAEYTPVEIVVQDNKCIYENKKCGYVMEFPAEWEEWFDVYESNSPDGRGQRTEIRFVGRTGAYSLGAYVKGKPEGMPMFCIVNDYERENCTLDSVIYLGETDTDKFYSATGTSIPWDFPVYPDGMGLDESEKQMLAELLSKIDLTEEDTTRLDKLKIRDMSEDIRTILESWTTT